MVAVKKDSGESKATSVISKLHVNSLICFISLILVFSMLCGCGNSGQASFQDVENIVSVEFYYDNGRQYNYSFDLENGILTSDTLDESGEYELEQEEIDVIRAAIVPAGKWTGDFRLGSGGLNYPERFNMTITYADGTSCFFKGESANGSRWPEGFTEMKSTFDDIVRARRYETD